MNIHILACGGAVMHNIALALHQLGHTITGSDDEIFEPALSRLQQAGICPPAFGWYPEKIDQHLDFIILGMHARADNPELLKAQSLGLKIYSFPDYVYEHAKNKTRVVIGGSHGKTTTTAMIMHVLKVLGKDFDYLVGSQLEGFDTMVKFSDAPLMIIEGDEYLTSPLDRVPKFLKYHPHVAMITGIAWDHINVFPTWENYVEQFKLFIETINPQGALVYFSGDKELTALAQFSPAKCLPYNTPYYHIRNNKVVIGKQDKHSLEIFGEHNLQNAEGACKVCQELGIDEDTFYHALSSFKGTAKRLEKVHETKNLTVFRDFAHSPSKLKATIQAVREQFPMHQLIAVFELHTFSSLNKAFLPQYADSMLTANQAFVYFNPEVIAHKKLEPIDNQDITNGFGNHVSPVSDIHSLKTIVSSNLRANEQTPTVLLLMSSGNFDNTQLW
jgi:UDP-N-acetylmuramate: L-alanyl-gamma-D-glutamyl-meso-diaminopimelate ligase